MVIVPWPHTPHLAGLPPRDAQGICSWEWGLEVLGPAQWHGGSAQSRYGQRLSEVIASTDTHVCHTHNIHTAMDIYTQLCTGRYVYTQTRKHVLVHTCSHTHVFAHIRTLMYSHAPITFTQPQHRPPRVGGGKVSPSQLPPRRQPAHLESPLPGVCLRGGCILKQTCLGLWVADGQCQ